MIVVGSWGEDVDSLHGGGKDEASFCCLLHMGGVNESHWEHVVPKGVG